MENLRCEICFENYDDSKVVPIVLDCGHTICESCIHNMKGNASQCPRCRKPITKDKEFVTNYLILSLVQEKEAKYMKEKTVKEEFSPIIEKLKTCQCLITKKVDPQEKVLQVMEECVGKLKESKRDEQIDVYSMMSTIASNLAEKEKTLKRNLEIVTKCLNLMEVKDECEASGCKASTSPMIKVAEMKPDLSLRNINKGASFLSQIRERLLVQVVYVAHPFEGKILYGKLGIENIARSVNWKVSALEAKAVPNGAFIIELQDLVVEYSICTFLEIRNGVDGEGGIIILDMETSSLANQFIKLCTGECGVSYKHSCLETEETYFQYFDVNKNISVVKKPFQERPKGLNDSKLFSQVTGKAFYGNDIVVGTDHDGNFWIWHVDADCVLTNVVGVARNLPDVDRMLHNDIWKIEDCGVYLN